ncbi:hypothetical protein V6N11_021765 [Hibiscus sabdariffa]|uniref:Uncharacterized protein n=1 Tax=Hibiscus sabdariffa TaxID=183260 RepID=A0ABR2TH68_9ROSI
MALISLIGANAPRADKDKFKKHMDDMLDVGCLMLATMTPELQKQHEYMVAYEMIQNLKEILKGKHDNREIHVQISNSGGRVKRLTVSSLISSKYSLDAPHELTIKLICKAPRSNRQATKRNPSFLVSRR